MCSPSCPFSCDHHVPALCAKKCVCVCVGGRGGGKGRACVKLINTNKLCVHSLNRPALPFDLPLAHLKKTHTSFAIWLTVAGVPGIGTQETVSHMPSLLHHCLYHSNYYKLYISRWNDVALYIWTVPSSYSTESGNSCWGIAMAWPGK